VGGQDIEGWTTTAVLGNLDQARSSALLTLLTTTSIISGHENWSSLMLSQRYFPFRSLSGNERLLSDDNLKRRRRLQQLRQRRAQKKKQLKRHRLHHCHVIPMLLKAPLNSRKKMKLCESDSGRK